MKDGRVSLLGSSIAKKIAAAVSGSVLLLFLLAHMLGNLKAFAGVKAGIAGHAWAIDGYAHFLRTIGEPVLPPGALLWIIRLILLAALLVHVTLVVDLARRNRGARPMEYARPGYARASIAARTMMWSGGLVLVFIVLHLMHFTTGSFAQPGWDAGEVHRHLAQAFRRPWLVCLYLLALAAVFPHLQHGAWSACQTLGWDDANRDARLRTLATGFAILVVLGFASVPLAFLLGWIPSAPVTALEGMP
jgi:succinate dehydrogenase / fumarate reductase cytochrome b subunit